MPAAFIAPSCVRLEFGCWRYDAALSMVCFKCVGIEVSFTSLKCEFVFLYLEEKGFRCFFASFDAGVKGCGVFFSSWRRVWGASNTPIL